MNGICAGGTGSFIDQMASLLQTDATGLNEYAKNYKALYTIAARCGVFAKTDIQPLINDGATKEDLSASIFQAVVNQTISGLACGKPIRGHVAFLGGPLHFLSEPVSYTHLLRTQNGIGFLHFLCKRNFFDICRTNGALHMLLLADADGGEKRTDTDTCSTQVINLINLKRGINLVGTGQNICNSIGCYGIKTRCV